jgi:leader peptidase (prepilin peptidase) / N-methyltransferase
MLSISLLIYFCFGLIVGSFINVLVLRSGARPLSGRSACMSCGKKIRWPDLIPVLSWILLRGRCRACGSRISMQYPAVEFLTGLAFAFVGGASLPIFATTTGLLICAVLIAIAAYDLRHTIILDSWVYAFASLALFFAFLSPLYFIPYTLYLVLAGPVVASPLFALWLVSKGQWIGLGDAKLALGIGWLLGPLGGVQALLLAFIIGAIVSVCILLPFPHIVKFLKRNTSLGQVSGGQGISHIGSSISYTMKSEIPFGPFLILACLLQWFPLLHKVPIPFLWQ